MLDERKQGRIAVLTIDRPQRRNSICVELVARLDRAFKACDADPTVQATVLTGAPPGFCAGSDLKELATLDLAGWIGRQGSDAIVDPWLDLTVEGISYRLVLDAVELASRGSAPIGITQITGTLFADRLPATP